MSLPALAATTTAALSIVLAAILLVYKSINGWRRRFAAVRQASYIAVFGELSSRGSYPQDILAAWTEDPVFRAALVDFMRLLDGLERDRLLKVARDLGIVDAAVTKLRQSRRKKERVKAATILSELADPRTVDVLMSALEDPISGVRVNASAALAKIGEPDLVEAILASVDRENEWDAARTMDHLVSLGAAAVDGLINYLGDVSERVPNYGRLAIQALGEIGDLRAEPTLLIALRHSRPDIRMAAGAALQTSGTERCVGPLIEALSDLDGRVRARCAKSLGAHFDGAAVEPLSACLRDREWWVRKNAAASLVHLPGGIEALQRALRDEDHFARDAAREQLMILGVPAGSGEGAPESDELGAGWVEDQLRTLEQGSASAGPDAASDLVEVSTPDWIADQLRMLEAPVFAVDAGGPSPAIGTAVSLHRDLHRPKTASEGGSASAADAPEPEVPPERGSDPPEPVGADLTEPAGAPPVPGREAAEPERTLDVVEPEVPPERGSDAPEPEVPPERGSDPPEPVGADLTEPAGAPPIPGREAAEPERPVSEIDSCLDEALAEHLDTAATRTSGRRSRGAQ